MIVESTTSNTAASTTTVTITKPTGLTAGDLLAVTLYAHSNGNTITGSWNTPSGWTAGPATAFSPLKANQATFYKIADSSDASASDFSFVHSTSITVLGGTLIRASGHQDSPFGTSDTEADLGVGTTAFSGSLASFTPETNGALVIMQVGGYTASQVNRTVSGYATTNVTYTEAYDSAGSIIGAGVTTASAYGIQSTAAAITSYTATFSGSHNDHFGTLLVFEPRDDANATHALVTTSSTSFSQTGTADVNTATHALVTATSQAFEQSGNGTSPTQWTNETTESTTWTNETL